MARPSALPQEETRNTGQLLRRLYYAEALHRCAQALQQPSTGHADQCRVLTDALEQLRVAAGTGRAALYRNFTDDSGTFCSGMIAESCAPGIPSSLQGGFADHIPWSMVPDGHARQLAGGMPVGGPTAEVFAGVPQLRAGLLAGGILSLQFFPVHMGAEWWGYLGFDDYANARKWDEEEVLLQRTAASMIGATLDRWRTEDRLQAAHDAAVIHAERQRLARDLHDTLTQSAYSIAVFARAGANALDTNDLAKTRSILQAMEATAGRVQGELRLFLFGLQAPEVGESTLRSALERRFAQVERRLGITAEVQGSLPSTLDAGTTLELQRIAEEALNNALKHAAATQVIVRMAGSEEWLAIEIADNGCGFDTLRSYPGLGLRTMQARAASMGGRAEIVSAADAGTTVRVTLAAQPGRSNGNAHA